MAERETGAVSGVAESGQPGRTGAASGTSALGQSVKTDAAAHGTTVSDPIPAAPTPYDAPASAAASVSAEANAPYRIAVFASGSGSNFQAIVDAVKEGRLDVSVELLVCDRPAVKVVERARAAGVPVLAFRAKEYGSRAEYERMILAELEARGVELVVLAGYMRIISQVLVEPYFGRMINIHPSLLPSFPGIDAIGQALRHGVKVTGVTVHFVDGGMDTGPIIAQRAVAVRDDDTEETLAARIHPVEHEMYPEAIRRLRQGRVALGDDGRKVQIID